MKKIIFGFFMMIFPLLSIAQINEGFEGATFPPTTPGNWAVYDNGVGTVVNWNVTSSLPQVHSGTKAAFLDRENIGQGNTSQDWLVTPQITVTANNQVRFFSRLTNIGDNQTTLEVRVSTNPLQSNLAAYTVVQSWQDNTMNATYNVYEEKVVSLAAYPAGTQLYIAFVKVHTQPGTAVSSDRWLIDDVKTVEQCLDPGNPVATAITPVGATLSWTNPSGATQWEVEVVPELTPPTGSGIIVNTNPYTYTGGNPSTSYQFYVRAICSGGVYSNWTPALTNPGILFFTTPAGSICTAPIVVPTLPYQVTGGNTSNSADFFDTPQGTLCGAVPTTTNYLGGNEIFYSYTAPVTGLISVTMTPVGATSTNSSLFIYNGCPNVGVSCIAGVANTGITPRAINLTVTAGQTYTIVISSSAATQTVGYNLLIQNEDCVPKPTVLGAINPTLTSADLSWTSPGFTTWEVAVQPLGTPIPSGAGVPVTTNPYTATGLTAATQYQYWVRAECTPGSGIFTAWAGPFPFNTAICNPVDACTHTFIMTDTASNGWNGARMDVRQNGIVVATIGSTFNAGAGPVPIPVQLCNGVPFDLVWSALGSQPAQCRVEIQNSFGQTILPPTGGIGAIVGMVVYTNTVNCTAPRCDITPINVTVPVATITTTTAVINWTAPATTSWDIYIVLATDPAPTATSTPTYDNVTTNPFTTTIPLIPDTTYKVYVRVNCSPDPSAWSAGTTFTTVPTCPKPTTLTVPAASITTTSATLTWVNGTVTDNSWEILLIPGPLAPPPPPLNPIVGGGTLLIPTTTPSPVVLPLGTLTPATIYYYYIRTVCSTSDKSTWAGPIKFNTVRCAPADTCGYKFVLTDSGSNGWNGARMEVRQNGILVTTLGAPFTTGATSNPPAVALCTGVPFELVWTVLGTAPTEVGISIQNPFSDIIYTKPASAQALGDLYVSVANCTPPTCPKPTVLTVTNITQTTADLNWTEMGTATQWEVYVAPVGSPAPVNGTPVSGTGQYYIANAPLPFTVTGLLPAKAYIYYVRAICSTTDIGTWTILNPKTFITKPINDECLFAIDVPVNPAQVCIQNVAGNTFGATLSTPTLTGAGCTTTDDDVWFKFVATNNIHIININTIVGTPTTVTLNHSVLSGACGSLVNMYCSDPDESVATGLTVGQTYYVRVYTAGSVAGQFATFNVCIKTPPPPGTNNECATAIPVTVNLTGRCLPINLAHGNIIGATASLPAPNPACTGTANDDVWFSFVATSNIHYLELLNVEGTTTNLNHAVYSGACGALVQKYCSAAGSLLSNNATFVIGQTYYIRVWSNSAAAQVTTFDVCVKSISTCENALPICGGRPGEPYIYENTVGVGDTGNIACLNTTPNPTYYTLHVGETGPIQFTITQFDDFAPNGDPIGLDHDVDYVAWGPFTSAESCAQISLTECPTCVNNTNPTSNYPTGNILDCSWDGNSYEIIHIPNAQAGEYYVILVTNYDNLPGKIKLEQTSGSGSTTCCDVKFGQPKNLCAASVVLNALEAVADLNNVPDAGTYEWFYNGSTTPIAGATGPTYTATQSGTYKVTGLCGLNLEKDTIIVTLGPIVDVTSPADYKVCDDASNDGLATFDLLTLNSQVLGMLDPLLYNVTYHLTAVAANTDTAAINTSVLFPNTTPFAQTIYIRVESIGLSICYDVVPVQLVVSPLVTPTFTIASNVCQNTGIVTLPLISNNGVTGTWIPTSVDTSVSGMLPYAFTPDAGQMCVVTPLPINITVDPEVIAVFTQIPNICQNATAPTLPLTSNNGVNGTWNPTTIDTSVTGMVHYTFIVDAGQTCALPGLGMDITIDPIITPTFTAIPNICINTTAPLLPLTSDNGITGTWLPTSIDTSVAGPVDYYFTPAAGQCAVTPTVPSLIITITPLTIPNFAAIPNFCSGTTAPVLGATSPNGITGTWLPAIINNNASGSYEFTPTTGQCADKQILVVTVIQTLTPNFVAIPPFCAGSIAPILATTSPNGVIGTWSPTAINNTVSGDYEFTPSVIVGQCAVPIIIPVTVLPAPEFEIKGDCDGTSYVLQALPISNYNASSVTYVWTGPNGAAGNTQSIVATAIGTYTCQITHQGCLGDNTLYVNTISCTIQKGISPNNDGDNDSFDLRGLGVKELSIFNRYGTKVYNFANYTNEWKGQSDKGQELPDGTYYYVIDQNNGETKTGWIYINK
jgi:gliding motility-associated-like protein